MELIKSSEHRLFSEKNMNGHYSHNLSHQKQERVKSYDYGEWEKPIINGSRTKNRISSVAALPQIVQEVKVAARSQARINNTSSCNSSSGGLRLQSEYTVVKQQCIEAKKSYHSQQVQQDNNMERAFKEGSAHNKNASKSKQVVCRQSYAKNNFHKGSIHMNGDVRLKSNFYQDCATSCVSVQDSAVGGILGSVSGGGGVYGVYSETKYTFSVNEMPRNPHQASAAAAFFAR